MKKWITTGAAVLTMLMTLSAANTPGSNELEDHLAKVMDYPEFAKKSNMEGMVLVEFTIDEEGQAHIRQMNSSDERFALHVEKKLNQLGSTLQHQCEPTGEPHVYKFTFSRK